MISWRPVDDKLPIACLEVLLPLGFDLHAARVHVVTEHADKVVAALVAAGVV